AGSTLRTRCPRGSLSIGMLSQHVRQRLTIHASVLNVTWGCTPRRDEVAISHLSSGEVASLLPLGDMLEQTRTTALFKEERLEVMRIVLPAGKGMPVHAVDGPVTVQCIEGEVD